MKCSKRAVLKGPFRTSPRNVSVMRGFLCFLFYERVVPSSLSEVSGLNKVLDFVSYEISRTEDVGAGAVRWSTKDTFQSHVAKPTYRFGRPPFGGCLGQQ